MTSYAQTLQLADHYGSKLVGFDNTNVYDKISLLAVPSRLEDYGGGVAATAAQNDAAFAALWAIFQSSSRGTIQLLEGTYLLSQPIRPASGNYSQMAIRGLGGGRTILQQTDANKNVLEFPGGLNQSLIIDGLSLQGAGTGTSYSGTGGGIYQQSIPNVNDSFNIKLRDVYVTNCGGDAIYIGSGFTVTIESVDINFCGGNGITGGNNTWLLKSCYVHRLPGANSIAYNLGGSSVTLINCNGVDQGAYWGRFGTSTIDGDAADGYCFATLIGCNIERVSKIGLDARNGGLTLLGTGFAPTASGLANQIAIRVRPLGCAGLSDRDFTGIPLGAGSSWANGYPVELAVSSNGILPFSTMLGINQSNLTGAAFYSNPAGSSRNMPATSFTTTDYYTVVRRENGLVATQALGFAVGAGGVVTQLTSKSTGVALNKPTGSITLSAAALAAATSVGFTFTNSFIGANDVVLVSIGAGATPDSYHQQVDAVGVGSCRISLRNTSAGALSEAVVLNFTVMKGANA